MPRVTAEEQASRVRIASLRLDLTTALGKFHEANPDLTWEEVLLSLNYMQRSAIYHLMTDDERGDSEQ